MKKNIAVLLILSLLVSMLTGCGGKQSDTKTESKKESTQLAVEMYDYAPVYKLESVNNPLAGKWKYEEVINPDFYMAVEDTITDYFDFSSMGEDYYYIAKTAVFDDSFYLLALSYDESKENIPCTIHAYEKNLMSGENKETLYESKGDASHEFAILKDRIIEFRYKFNEAFCVNGIEFNFLYPDGTVSETVDLYEILKNVEGYPVETVDEPNVIPFSLAYDATDENIVVQDTRTGNTYFIDKTGELAGAKNISDDGITNAELITYSREGEPVFAGRATDGRTFNVFTYDGTNAKVILENDEFSPSKLTIDNHGKILFINDNNEIRTLDTVTGICTRNYITEESVLEDVINLYRDADGNIWLYYNGNRAVKIAPTIKVKEANIVIQGFGYVPDPIRAEYKKYEESHFGVTFTEGEKYDDSQLEYAVGAIATQMAKGEGPDILCVSSEYYELLQEKGCLMCLDGLISDDIKGQMYKGIQESGKVDGATYMIPYYVTVKSVLVSNDTCDKATWTIDDLLNVISKREKEGNPYKALAIDSVGQAINPVSLFVEDITNTKFVDYEKAKCSFDSKEFINILKTCQKYSYTNAGLDNASANKGSFYAGDILGMTTWRCGFMEYEEMCDLYGNNNHFIGYPTERGNGTFISSDMEFVINANTEKLDVITDFIRSAYSFSNVDITDVVLRKDSFISQFRTVPAKELGYPGSEMMDAMETPYGLTELKHKSDGTTYRDDYIAFLDNALVYDVSANTIRTIILEETEPMLSGDKTPEETAKVIQSRVSLYLMERQ